MDALRRTSNATMPPRRRWDIFGKVVDNFGDAGVGWRLARQLAAEHALDVTLWQDDLAPLARIAPGIDPSSDVQRGDGRDAFAAGPSPSPTLAPADVVVEAFGCGLPDATSRRWRARRPRPRGSSSNT